MTAIYVGKMTLSDLKERNSVKRFMQKRLGDNLLAKNDFDRFTPMRISTVIAKIKHDNVLAEDNI